MTTITAVKKNNTLSICSDSLTLFGHCKETEKHVISNSKVIKQDDSYIGCTGHPSLEEIILNQSPTPNLTHFISQLHQSLNKSYFLNHKTNHQSSFKPIPIELLTISPQGIFEVDYQGSIREYKYFSAIGSGEEYALGAIRALYNTTLNSEQIAIIGVEAAAKFDRKTELPTFSQTLHL